MRLYKAVPKEKKEKLNIFSHPKKPKGIYFAPSKEIAEKWGKNLYKDKEFDLIEVEVPANLEVIGARDGWIVDFPKDAKYFVGTALEVAFYLLNNPLKFYIDGELEINEYALPEIIIKEKDIEKINIV